MPYIIRTERANYDEALNYFPTPLTPGHLNYALTKMIRSYIIEHGRSYDTYNSVVVVLECAKLELYRRVVAGYEDEKIGRNGDVFEVTDLYEQGEY